jgi:hypothetical protein
MAGSSVGAWPSVQELFERGDPAFVDELRRVTDADRLGAFAKEWLADHRPVARQLLIDYLSRPLNAFRHEALVKRLFKLAEAAGNDELIGCFLAAFDRALRRQRRQRTRYASFDTTSRNEADQWLAQRKSEGFGRPPDSAQVSDWGRGRFYAYASKTEEVVIEPRDTMFRPHGRHAHGSSEIYVYPALERKLKQQRLFTPRTRRYLRRRAWRYFRTLGKTAPDRYVAAMTSALRCYTDDDVRDGLALMDNWGLMHALFHHSPALEFPAIRCRFAEGKSFADLTPAPAFPELWRQRPEAVFDLLLTANCRTVRQWARQMLAEHRAYLTSLPIHQLFGLLAHRDPDVVAFGVEVLGKDERLDNVLIENWLRLLDTDEPQVLESICELMAARLKPERLTLADAVLLARSRPLPVARLGLDILRTKQVHTEANAEFALTLVDAECDLLREDIVRWLRGSLGSLPNFRKEWVLEVIDSRFAEVRAEGWAWLEGTPELRDDRELWQKLFESPYDDVKLKLVAELERRVAEGDPVQTRFLWASVLLNIHRGGRAKPRVVAQVVRRIDQHPSEVEELLPLLAVALRSIRGPEFRAGLSGVVRLVERQPALAKMIEGVFPELNLVGQVANLP